MQEDEGRLEDPDKSTLSCQANRKRNDAIHMKILVPSGAVGAIIGKGGESIAQVQWETGARIKLSKPNDFYPGTMERVCLIQGTLDGVTRMHNYIMDRMLEKPECIAGSGVQTAGSSATAGIPSVPTAGEFGVTGAWSTGAGTRLPWGRHQQVKILVPNCTAGLVIGKDGSYVKEIKSRTGAFIQISQKSKEINLTERCITIAGEPEQCRAAVALVLAKIAEDPQSTSCPTISYSRVQGPVASAYPTGSPFALVSVGRVAGTGPVSTQTVAQAAEVGHSATGYMPLSDPYMSPMIQAALMQAAALALNQRCFYHPTGQPSFIATSPPPSGAQQQASQSTAHPVQVGIPQSGAEGQIPVTSTTSTEMGLYATLPQSGSPHILPPGATGMWADSSWAATREPHSTHPLAGVGPTGSAGPPSASFEHAYHTPLNFAYFPAGQQILTPMGSRNPSESFPSSSDLFHTSPYAANLPLAFGGNPPSIRPTSPAATSPLGPMYPGLYSHLPPIGSTDVASPVSKLTALGATPSTVSLSELFNTMRLTGPNYPTSEISPTADLSHLFSALTQHPAGFVNVGGYPVFSSSTGPQGITLMETAHQQTVQAPPPPQLSVVSIEPSPGTTYSIGTAGDLHSTVTSHAPRPPPSSDSSGRLLGGESVPMITRLPIDPSDTSASNSKSEETSCLASVPVRSEASSQPSQSHSQSMRLSPTPCTLFESSSSSACSASARPTAKVAPQTPSEFTALSDPLASQLEPVEIDRDIALSSRIGDAPFDPISVSTATETLSQRTGSGKRILNGRPSGPKADTLNKYDTPP